VVERLSQLGHQDEQQTGDKVDYVAQIRELKGLLDDGILTQEEFDSAKQEILKKF
jgi:cytochrome c-type biogenesis protein CcmH/NrfG